MAPKTTTIRIRPMSEITRPAMASPLGALNTPQKESTRPRIHRIQSNTGTQQKISASKARMNPAVPNPLEPWDGAYWIITVCCEPVVSFFSVMFSFSILYT